MKIELKKILEQLTDICDLPNDHKVAAIIDEDNNNEILGWEIVKVYENNAILPIDAKVYITIKDLIEGVGLR